MRNSLRLFCVTVVALARVASADSTAFVPGATGFTLPNAQQAMSAKAADYATAAGSAGYATNAGTATSAANAKFATTAGSAATAESADSANSAITAGTAAQAAGLTPSNSCPAGKALSVTKGVLGCVSSVTSISGTLNGAQITGNITNVGTVRASGNITAGGNVGATGYVNGNNGLYSGNGVYAADYYGRGGGSNANFNGAATSATHAATAGSADYAATTDIGILHQRGTSGDGSSFYCNDGYHLVFYDLNVDSTNNAFFYQCVQNGQ